MARVVGVDLPVNKRVEIGLTYIYGIGRSRATSIVREAEINPDTRVRELDEAQLGRAVAQLSSVGSAWDARLQRIKRIAEAIERSREG